MEIKIETYNDYINFSSEVSELKGFLDNLAEDKVIQRTGIENILNRIEEALKGITEEDIERLKKESIQYIGIDEKLNELNNDISIIDTLKEDNRIYNHDLLPVLQNIKDCLIELNNEVFKRSGS